MIKTIFFGSSSNSIIVLEKLIESSHFKVIACVSQSDEKTENPVHQLAIRHNIKSIRTKTLEVPVFLEDRDLANPDIGIVADFGLLIPPPLLESAKYGYINLHPSLLPKYRGTIPVEATILEGDQETGVTLIKMTEKFDEGPILVQRSIPLNGSETRLTLYQRLYALGAELLVQEVPKYIEGKLKPKPQKGKGSYYPRIAKDAGRIDWSKSDQEIEAMVRAYEGWPGTFTTIGELISKYANKQMSNDKLVKILRAHLDDGKLVIDKLQIEGKNPISWEAFENGYLR